MAAIIQPLKTNVEYIFYSATVKVFDTVDRTFEEFKEQSQRSVLHRTVNAVESFILFAIEKINSALESTNFQAKEKYKSHNISRLVTHSGTSDASAVLLSYRRREETGISARLNRRIRRMMHHTVDLRPFEATIRVFHETDEDESDDDDYEEQVLLVSPQNEKHSRLPSNILSGMSKTKSSTKVSTIFNKMSPKRSPQKRQQRKISPRKISPNNNRGSPRIIMYTPMSFPPSPRARHEVLSNFSSATEKLLKHARSILEDEIEERKRLSTIGQEESFSSASSTPTSCTLVQFGSSTQLKHPDIILQLSDSGVTLENPGSSNTTTTGGTVKTVQLSVKKSLGKKSSSSCDLSSLSSLSFPPSCERNYTVRSSAPLPSPHSTSGDINVYYEYHISHLSNASKNLKLSVGLSTICVPLHKCVGTYKSTECCGMLFDKNSYQVNLGDTIGVLTKILRSPNQEVCTATVQFSVNGQLIKTKNTIAVTVKITEKIWPSLTLKSNIFVLGFFGASDIRYSPSNICPDEVVIGLDGVVF